MTDLPYRLKALRRQSQLSLEMLAQRTGLTKSYLSKLERSVSEPSISTVLKLADAYKLSVSELIGVDQKEDDIACVVRHNERTPLDQRGQEHGFRYEAVAGKRVIKSMNPFVMYPPKINEAKPVSFPHPGEEFMFVIRGTVSITVGTKSFDLGVGDSIYFDSELPHKITTISEEEAEVLVVTSRVHAHQTLEDS